MNEDEMTQPESSQAPQWGRPPIVWLLLAVAAGLLTLWLAVPTDKVLNQVGLNKVGPNHEGVGTKLATLSLRPLTFAGNDLTLDNLQSRVVVLNFWGTWCPPCREELPHVAELARKYKQNERCRVLAVSCGGGADPISAMPELQSETARLLAARHIELPVYADPEAVTRRAVEEAVGFDGYPTTLVLDSQAVIRGIWTGYAPGEEKSVAELVEQMLGKVAAP
jgi:thiol-disulfide isomerase/thioredoxin